jgi:glycerol-3-phosphate dehydrogenase (NAD(P)+)
MVVSINKDHENKEYFPGVNLSSNISATTSITEALQGSCMLIIAIPTQAVG